MVNGRQRHAARESTSDMIIIKARTFYLIIEIFFCIRFHDMMTTFMKCTVSALFLDYDNICIIISQYDMFVYNTYTDTTKCPHSLDH